MFESLGRCVKPHEQILLAVDVLKANFFFKIVRYLVAIDLYMMHHGFLNDAVWHETLDGRYDNTHTEMEQILTYTTSFWRDCSAQCSANGGRFYWATFVNLWTWLPSCMDSHFGILSAKCTYWRVPQCAVLLACLLI